MEQKEYTTLPYTIITGETGYRFLVINKQDIIIHSNVAYIGNEKLVSNLGFVGSHITGNLYRDSNTRKIKFCLFPDKNKKIESDYENPNRITRGHMNFILEYIGVDNKTHFISMMTIKILLKVKDKYYIYYKPGWQSGARVEYQESTSSDSRRPYVSAETSNTRYNEREINNGEMHNYIDKQIIERVEVDKVEVIDEIIV